MIIWIILMLSKLDFDPYIEVQIILINLNIRVDENFIFMCLCVSIYCVSTDALQRFVIYPIFTLFIHQIGIRAYQSYTITVPKIYSTTRDFCQPLARTYFCLRTTITDLAVVTTQITASPSDLQPWNNLLQRLRSILKLSIRNNRKKIQRSKN